MLPNLYVRPTQAADQAALEALIETIGPQCICKQQGRQNPVVLAQRLVAVQADAVIGFVCWLQDEMQAVIVGLGVSAYHRRFGVATLLVNELVEYLRTAGLRLLEVAVDSDDRAAIGVFDSAGFRQLVDAGYNGRLAFERRLWGWRNRADGFSQVTTDGIC